MNKALEKARAEKFIGKPLEAKVELHATGELNEFLGGLLEQLPDLFIVSQVELKNDTEGAFADDVEGLSVTVLRAEGEKCVRCWKYSTTVGENAEHPQLCARCAAVIK